MNVTTSISKKNALVQGVGYQQILWLDITMADANATVDVCQRPAYLSHKAQPCIKLYSYSTSSASLYYTCS